MSDKTILEQWRAIAYDQQADRNKLQQFWAKYFNIEKNIYAQLLENPDEVVTGTVKELAEKYNQEVLTMVGFLDGINDSLKVQNPIETMDENTTVSLCFDKELLYKNMVDAEDLHNTLWGTGVCGCIGKCQLYRENHADENGDHSCQYSAEHVKGNYCFDNAAMGFSCVAQ